MVRGNAARNGVADRVETVCANVFDLVRQDCEEGRQFGLVIICDPPAFAKSRSALDGAYQGLSRAEPPLHAADGAGRLPCDVLVQPVHDAAAV